MPERPPEQTAASPVRVLIVDDHPVIRSGLCAMLDSDGVVVVGEASDGEGAIARVSSLQPDVVLMDVRLPDMDGLDATRLIREQDPSVAVVMLTSFENQDYLRRAIQAGAAGYLLKGMSREALVGAIRNAAEGSSIFDSSMIAGLLSELPAEPARARLLGRLDDREHATLCLVAGGLTNRQIAERLGYSVGTIKGVIQQIIEKLEVNDRTQAAVVAAQAGLPIDENLPIDESSSAPA